MAAGVAQAENEVNASPRFLSLTGIDGDSKDLNHEMWIDVIDVRFGSSETEMTDILEVADGRDGAGRVKIKHLASSATRKIQEAYVSQTTIDGGWTVRLERNPVGSYYDTSGGADFERVEIIDGKAYLDVSVYTNSEVKAQGEGEGWGVATNGVITVPAEGKQGFFYLMSKPAVSDVVD